MWGSDLWSVWPRGARRGEGRLEGLEGVGRVVLMGDCRLGGNWVPGQAHVTSAQKAERRGRVGTQWVQDRRSGGGGGG